MQEFHILIKKISSEEPFNSETENRTFGMERYKEHSFKKDCHVLDYFRKSGKVQFLLKIISVLFFQE